MIGIQLDPARMAMIAEGLRIFIPTVSPEAARPMIDAAAELQRLADQVSALRAEHEKAVQKIVQTMVSAATCNCDSCNAKRTAASKVAPGSLN